ncbi:hypothetical protein V2G26_003982 [Clonostachys chloroleuca]
MFQTVKSFICSNRALDVHVRVPSIASLVGAPAQCSPVPLTQNKPLQRSRRPNESCPCPPKPPPLPNLALPWKPIPHPPVSNNPLPRDQPVYQSRGLTVDHRQGPPSQTILSSLCIRSCDLFYFWRPQQVNQPATRRHCLMIASRLLSTYPAIFAPNPRFRLGYCEDDTRLLNHTRQKRDVHDAMRRSMISQSTPNRLENLLFRRPFAAYPDYVSYDLLLSRRLLHDRGVWLQKIKDTVTMDLQHYQPTTPSE